MEYGTENLLEMQTQDLVQTSSSRNSEGHLAIYVLTDCAGDADAH